MESLKTLLNKYKWYIAAAAVVLILAAIFGDSAVLTLAE